MLVRVARSLIAGGESDTFTPMQASLEALVHLMLHSSRVRMGK